MGHLDEGGLRLKDLKPLMKPVISMIVYPRWVTWARGSEIERSETLDEASNINDSVS